MIGLRSIVFALGVAAQIAVAPGAVAQPSEKEGTSQVSETKRATVERRLDLLYSAEHQDRRKIDVFLPGANANGCCIFFVHGGGWAGGDKESWHSVMGHFSELGYVCTSAEYHLAPDWRFPKQVEDLRIALSFVKSRAEEYGFGPQRIAVFGSSAGAHLAAMLATLQPDDELGMTPEVTVRDTVPQAAVCLCGVLTCHYYDEDESHHKMIDRFLGVGQEENPELVRQASPIDRVCGKEPPFIMIVGDADDVTPISLHETMRDRLEAAGGSAELIVLPGVPHGYGYGVWSDAQKQMLVHVERFLKEVFGLS